MGVFNSNELTLNISLQVQSIWKFKWSQIFFFFLGAIVFFENLVLLYAGNGITTIVYVINSKLTGYLNYDWPRQNIN